MTTNQTSGGIPATALHYAMSNGTTLGHGLCKCSAEGVSQDMDQTLIPMFLSSLTERSIQQLSPCLYTILNGDGNSSGPRNGNHRLPVTTRAKKRTDLATMLYSKRSVLLSTPLMRWDKLPGCHTAGDLLITDGEHLPNHCEKSACFG